MLKSSVPADSLRLIAIDIDGTLLSPEFRISETDLATLRRVHSEGTRSFSLPDAATLLPYPSPNSLALISG